LSVNPSSKMGVIDKLILLEKFVNDHPASRQSMKTVVLIVFVAVLVHSDNFASYRLVFLLDIPLSPARPFASYIQEHGLKLREEARANFIH
jgi:hypothetical protein